MRMAREASTAATGGFVLQLKAKRQHEGQDTFEECLPIAKELEVDRFAPEIDGDGAVFAGLAGSVAHGHPSGIRSRKRRRYNEGNALKSQGHHEGLRGLPRKAMECVIFRSSEKADWRAYAMRTSDTKHPPAWLHRGLNF